MSADEIRRLAESGVLDSACGFDIDKDCVNACDADEIGECRHKRDIRAALLAYAAMVERCDWQKSHLNGLLEGKDYTLTGVTLRQVVDTEKSIVDYILHGDVGKEGA